MSIIVFSLRGRVNILLEKLNMLIAFYLLLQVQLPYLTSFWYFITVELHFNISQICVKGNRLQGSKFLEW